MYFLPFVVFKLARGHHGDLLRRESRRAGAAARSPFWSDVAVRSLRLGRWGVVSRRHGQVQASDWHAIAALAERRLAAAAAFVTAPALAFVAENALVARLRPQARRRVEAALRPVALPVTGMHGDFHMFNFCVTGSGGFGLLDWEYYSERGSFVVDYVEFHVSTACFRNHSSWPEHLARATGPDASAVRAAGRFGADADAIWLLYLLIKLDIIVEQRGGFAALPDADRARFLGIVGAQLERMTPAAA